MLLSAYEVTCGFGAAAVVVSEGPLVHVGVGQGVQAAQFRLFPLIPFFAFVRDPGQAFLLALTADGEGPHFAPPHVQNLFGRVAVAAVHDAVFFVVAFVVAAFEGVFGDPSVAVSGPVVAVIAGQNVPDGCQVLVHVSPPPFRRIRCCRGPVLAPGIFSH